ncbi:MAG: GcrA cell cycle regulator, partial [Sphingomonadales bacterium]|nr:GcrA cell cycle regulator [Sphingomonadales bacterium]
MSWTDDRIAQLKKCWDKGLSASQIATELGEGVTRNAVIGKVHRLGLSNRTTTTTKAKAAP